MASEIEAKNLKKETKKTMTAQARLIVIGLAISTAFIFASAWFATCSIDKNMNSAYKNFGQVLSKTLAIEGVELTKEIEDKLSPFERKVVGYYLKGYHYTDIARLTNKPPKSIDNALSRIKKKLQFLKERV